MRALAGWFLLAFGASWAVLTAVGAWITWGSDPESFGFGTYTLPLAGASVVAVAVAVLGGWMVRPPRSAPLWWVGGFLALAAIDLLLRASDVLVAGELDGVQLNEGFGSGAPTLVLALAALAAFGGAGWLRHLRRSAVSPI